MSQGRTPLLVLPNEVFVCIFDYLLAHDILQAFTPINHRLDELVRFYIKRIDLTDGWQGSRHDWQWLSRSLETLKVDQHYAHLLADSNDPSSVTFPRGKQKSLFNSIRTKLRTGSRTTASSSTDRLPRLHSLHLVNVPDWVNLIAGMSSRTLHVWSDDDRDQDGSIPLSVIRFSGNIALSSRAFHLNLTDLNISIRSMTHLLEIIERTPHIQHLSVTFSSVFGACDPLMTTTRRRLSNLHNLSFRTNAHLPFEQIVRFIDECCPHATLLHRLTLQVNYVIFREDIWSAVVAYQHTFDRFDFYGSFIVENEIAKHRMISSINDPFYYHIEDADPVQGQTRFVHIYSRPFRFDELHGFISCSELSTRCSLASVRHLYLTKAPLARPISFQSLRERMPHLLSVHCDLSFVHGRQVKSSPIVFEEASFRFVRCLHFRLHCSSSTCVCHTLLFQLIDRMPRLQCLTTSDDGFQDAWHPLPPIERLDLRQYDFRLLDNLGQHVPHLSTLSFPYMKSSVEALSHALGSLYLQITSLKFVSIRTRDSCDLHQKSFRKTMEQVIVHLRDRNERFRHLTLVFNYGSAEFALRNP